MEPATDATPRTHLVLARKYRPQKFGEVVEQQTAVRAIQNAMDQGRLASAYLFFGPRGVGKTTIARLLAKRVNCENVQSGEPCDACENCLAIKSGNSLDVMEIDAASHRGIHHVRELRENVKFQPMAAKKKVYIIDEVHMLTTESFNALLKTLEEPPAHVLFVLATTELNKIPETILSRCQVFNFRKVPLKTIQNYLRELLDREGVPAEDEALFWIARRGDGSVRDSLSFLEQAVTYCDGELSAEKVKELIGHVPSESFLQLTRNLLNPEVSRSDLVRPLHDIWNAGGDLGRYIWEYLDFLRVAVHIRSGIEDQEFLGLPGPEIARLREELHDALPEKLTAIFQSVYHLLNQSFALRLRNSYETRVLAEIELLDLKEKLSRPSLTGVLKKLNQLSADLGGDQAGSGAPAASSPTPPRASANPAPTQTPVAPQASANASQVSAPDAFPPPAPGASTEAPASYGGPHAAGSSDASAGAGEAARAYSAEYELQRQFLGTVVNPDEAPPLDEAEDAEDADRP